MAAEQPPRNPTASEYESKSFGKLFPETPAIPKTLQNAARNSSTSENAIFISFGILFPKLRNPFRDESLEFTDIRIGWPSTSQLPWRRNPQKKGKKGGSLNFLKDSLKKKGGSWAICIKKEDPPFFAPFFLGMASIPKKKEDERSIPSPKKKADGALQPQSCFFWYFPFLFNSNFQNCIPEFGFAQGSFYARPLAKCFDAKILLGKIDFRSSILSFTTFSGVLLQFRQNSDKIQTKFRQKFRQNSDKIQTTNFRQNSDNIQTTNFRQNSDTNLDRNSDKN